LKRGLVEKRFVKKDDNPNSSFIEFEL